MSLLTEVDVGLERLKTKGRNVSKPKCVTKEERIELEGDEMLIPMTQVSATET